MTGAPETDHTDRRPRWRRKRWCAAGLLLALVAYPASEGPARYAAYRTSRRGWFPFRVYDGAYSPLYGPTGRPYLGQPFWDYILWWHAAAMSHEGELDSPP